VCFNVSRIQLSKQNYFLTIYGNHESVDLIKSLRNEDGSSCWLSGNIREWQGLRIEAVNGNIAIRKRKAHCHTIQEGERLVEGYTRSIRMDMVVTHEAPQHPY